MVEGRWNNEGENGSQGRVGDQLLRKSSAWWKPGLEVEIWNQYFSQQTRSAPYPGPMWCSCETLATCESSTLWESRMSKEVCID